MTSSAADRIAAAFLEACGAELDAPKPGNVHVFAAGRDLTIHEFLRSAEAAAAPIATPGAPVGTRIDAAVAATFRAVGTNTNLGIILLCAPLAAAAELALASPPASGGLRPALSAVLDRLDIADAELAFGAIRRMSPAGLGRAADHDVFSPASVTLRQAMAAAAERDRIAHQYVAGFADIFEIGEPVLVAGLRRWSDPAWATLAAYLAFLSAYPDTHILRKHGAAAAAEVRLEAERFRERLAAAEAPAALLPELLAWDAALKGAARNPGTSADLTVASLFTLRLRKILPSARNNG
jgi:triphosphoribosyl-dephospho-CoA synthase